MNHLGPFFLTLELLPNIIETASSSGDGLITFMSSGAHRRNFAGEVNFDTTNSEADYGRMKSYGRSKLYNVCEHHIFTAQAYCDPSRDEEELYTLYYIIYIILHCINAVF